MGNNDAQDLAKPGIGTGLLVRSARRDGAPESSL